METQHGIMLEEDKENDLDCQGLATKTADKDGRDVDTCYTPQECYL